MSQLFLTESSNREETEFCPLCNSDKRVTDMYNGEEICVNCGCVLNTIPLYRGVDGYSQNNSRRETNHRHHGASTNLGTYDKGLFTRVNGGWDSQGNRLNGKTRTQIKRMKRQDDRSKTDDTQMRNLSAAMTILSRMSSDLHLSAPVHENAAHIYRKALSLNLIRGRSIDAFVGASVYAACRILKMPRTLKQVSKSAKRSHSEVSKTYRLLHRELKLRPPIDNPMKFLPEIASKINISPQTEFLAADILQEAHKLGELVGKGPRGLAAGAIYLAAERRGEPLIQGVVAKAAGTTEVTLRNRYRRLKKALEPTQSK